MKLRFNVHKVNQVSIVEFKVNLRILITNKDINLSDILDIPTDDNVLKALIPDGDSNTDTHDMSVRIFVPDATEVPNHR